jgi:transcription initiation factor TFIIH subunit 4
MLSPFQLLGNITRDSAKAAFRLGISAHQIIGFLTTHAHPIAAKSHPIIPENVTDQLKLWQAEKKRYTCQAAVVVDVRDVAEGSYLVTLYDQLVRYAADMRVLVWTNAQQREFGVTPEGFSHVQAYAETLDSPR